MATIVSILPEKSVLIIDPDPITRDFLAKLLRFNGLLAESVRTATEALALLETRAPDLLIIDPDLPDLDGTKLLLAIRQDPSFQNIPVLFLTRTPQTPETFSNTHSILKGSRGPKALLELIASILV